MGPKCFQGKKVYENYHLHENYSIHEKHRLHKLWINWLYMLDCKKMFALFKISISDILNPYIIQKFKEQATLLTQAVKHDFALLERCHTATKPTSWKFCFEKHCWSSVFFCVGDLLKERSQHFLGIRSWAQSVWTHRIQSVHSFSHFSRIFLLVRPTQVRGLGAPNTFDSF